MSAPNDETQPEPFLTAAPEVENDPMRGGVNRSLGAGSITWSGIGSTGRSPCESGASSNWRSIGEIAAAMADRLQR